MNYQILQVNIQISTKELLFCLFRLYYKHQLDEAELTLDEQSLKVIDYKFLYSKNIIMISYKLDESILKRFSSIII